MNVKRIVVDELPKSCISCQFVEHFEMLQSTCSITHHIAYRHKRPEWCPLEVEEVCEWEYLYWEHESQYNYKTECKEYPSMIYKNKHTYCPSCGKRIVYKESE